MGRGHGSPNSFDVPSAYDALCKLQSGKKKKAPLSLASLVLSFMKQMDFLYDDIDAFKRNPVL